MQSVMLRDIRLRIDDEHCRACRKCLAGEVCKVRAIVRLDPDEPPFIDVSRCYDCRLCISACPFGAISVARSFNRDTPDSRLQAVQGHDRSRQPVLRRIVEWTGLYRTGSEASPPRFEKEENHG